MCGDLNSLIAKHSGLVYSQLHKFHLVDDQDAESIGYEALYNAIRDYDETKGTKISTVATVYIYNALGSYVRSLNSKRQIQTVSYNDVAYSDDAEDHEFLELLSSGETVEGDYIRRELCRLALAAFNNQYDKLTNEKHKEILKVWQDSEFTETTKGISKIVGVSQSYVSQVINNFKHRLRKELEDMYYD